MNNISYQIEEDIAYQYSKKRPLYRPNTSYVKVGLKWFGILLLILLVSLTLSILGGYVINNNIEKPNCFVVLGISLVLCLFVLRWFLIDCVKLYQRYAPEEVRRRCSLMPTCSEYAIMCFRKYGALIGLYLTAVRLYKRCDGNFRIEYPSFKY